MAANLNKLRTSKLKKEKKLLAKKRRREAFLKLIHKDKSSFKSAKKKKSADSFQESYKALKDELQKYQTKESVEPSLFLTDEGQSALVNFTSNGIECSSPLFIKDIYHLLLKSLLADLSPFPIRWANLERPKNISKIVLIEIDKLSYADVIEINSELNQKNLVFPHVFEVVSSNSPFATEISTSQLAAEFNHQMNENNSSFLPERDADEKPIESSKEYIVSKLHLLLSPIQMAMEHYPLPPNVFELSNCKDYIFSKDYYTPVTAESPMFAMDCEMCRTTSGKHELTRIAVVNEDLETVYHTLVKPKLEVVDYMTRFSGVTEKMLNKVTTTLDDVHAEIRRILPSDAILCGQSLNCDLHALKMIHPYVIDTSIIFNEHGMRNKKTSLKKLTRIHLKEIIQNSKRGHHPIEDSIATMKLVQLKLRKGIDYGDAVLNPEQNEEMECEIMDVITGCPDKEKADSSNSNFNSNPKFSDLLKLNTDPGHSGFFEKISKCSKRVCLIGNEDSLSKYYFKDIPKGITKVTKSKNKKILKTTLSNLSDHDLIISHLIQKDNFCISEMNEGLKQIYTNFPNKTLFILMAGVDQSKDEHFKHSYCMSVLKNIRI